MQKTPKNTSLKILFFDEVDSTNDIALELAKEGSPHGTVIAADAQRKGRGRLGRTWHSPPGKNIYMSIILRPRFSALDIPLLTPLIAVSSAKAIGKITGVKPVIKWPNDLMVAGRSHGLFYRKLGGILLEMRQDGQKNPIIAAGIGINVNMEAGDFPPELHATSLLIETGKKHEKMSIIEAISDEILNRIEGLREARAEFLNEWRGLLITLGETVSVVTERETVSGLAVDIDENGSLIIKTSDGGLKTIRSGDVIPKIAIGIS